MKTVILCILLTYSFLDFSESAKILGMFPLAGRSVNILSNKLMAGLANAGHNVTLIAAHKPQEKIENGSLRFIHLTGFWEEYEVLLEEFDPWNIREESNMLLSKGFMDLLAGRWDKAFKIPEVRELLHSNETFDAVIIEDVWMDCFKILSQIFDCPLIVFTSFGGNNPQLNAAIGNPLPPSYIPHMHLVGPHFQGMHFFHRVHNFIFYVVEAILKYSYIIPSYNRILKANFENPPDLSTFYSNISLVLLGSHSSLRQAAPMLPNEIEIGGFHIDPPKKLPKDLQDFLDGATHGAIYFSLGSHAESKDLPVAIKELLLHVFGKLKHRILWKFEEELPNKPENVLIKKWMPQTDILAHPNIKLFITHGGHGSTLETIYHGVPCLMVPLFFDQFNNAYSAVQKGIALKIDCRDQTEATLMGNITELLDNPKYMNNAKRIQHLFHDRPMKPLDTAIYWIEYVIRHKGADHLKIVGRDMPWYQFYSLDVIFFLLISFFVTIYVSYLIFQKILCCIKPSQKQKIH